MCSVTSVIKVSVAPRLAVFSFGIAVAVGGSSSLYSVAVANELVEKKVI